MAYAYLCAALLVIKSAASSSSCILSTSHWLAQLQMRSVVSACTGVFSISSWCRQFIILRTGVKGVDLQWGWLHKGLLRGWQLLQCYSALFYN